ncbi:MAG: D-alanyl-D-alanine carboxypeptidase family protein [Nitrospirota bacterium]
MLTSFISLYIAATMPPDIIPQEELTPSTFDISELLSTKTLEPVKDPLFISPIIEAKSSISIDMASDKILFEKNAHERLPIASITKLMTLTIVTEENDPTEVVTISNYAANIEGSQMYLRAGEQISLENLLYGAIIHSANDAAVALAEHNAGSVDAFVEKMNKKAQEFGLENTNYSNPIGLDDYNNYSSSYDIAILSKHIYQNQFVRHAAKLKELEVKSVDGTYSHLLQSTNALLGNEYLNIKGLKTGKTDGAGLCLVAVAETDTGNEIITVVLNSPDRFYETKILVDWIFRAYTW